MPVVLACERCGAELPPEAAHGPAQCAYCGTTSVPAPRVVERVVERIVVVPGGDVEAGARARSAGLPQALGLPCPRCGSHLAEGRTPGHTLRGCRTCGGVFLEPQTVAALERERDEMVLHTVKGFMPIFSYPTDQRPLLSCPICRLALVRLDLAETGHSINTCEKHGSFFDRGGVPVFADLCQARRAGEVTEEDLENAGVKKGWW
jgi:hypothetical protein